MTETLLQGERTQIHDDRARPRQAPGAGSNRGGRLDADRDAADRYRYRRSATLVQPSRAHINRSGLQTPDAE